MKPRLVNVHNVGVVAEVELDELTDICNAQPTDPAPFAARWKAYFVFPVRLPGAEIEFSQKLRNPLAIDLDTLEILAVSDARGDVVVIELVRFV